MPIQTKTSGTARDKDDKSFVESPLRGPNFSSREVVIANPYDVPVPVDPTTRGKLKPFYGYISGAPLNIETKILELIIPTGKGFELNRILCSGNNIARFLVKIDESTISGTRSTWGNFNARFDLIGLELIAGQKIEVYVINHGQNVEDFEATILGGEYDE